MLHNLLFITWNPNPNFWTIAIGDFRWPIKWYGILWGLSLFSGFFLGNYIFRKTKRDVEQVTIIIQYVFIGGLIGSRLAHIVFYQLDYYVAHPLDILAVWKGGLASHGGVVGGLIGLYLYCRRHKDFDFFWLLDHGIIAVMFLASFIRFGNLMNQELCGKITDVPWAFIFPEGDVHPGQPCHPVVLYESIAYFFMQLFMLYLFNKYKESKPGLYLVTFLFGVFTVRFLLEFFKDADGAMIFGVISKTQALDLPFMIAGSILFYFVAQGKLHYKQQAVHG